MSRSLPLRQARAKRLFLAGMAMLGLQTCLDNSQPAVPFAAPSSPCVEVPPRQVSPVEQAPSDEREMDEREMDERETEERETEERETEERETDGITEISDSDEAAAYLRFPQII